MKTISENSEILLEPAVGFSIRQARLRAGITQVQLARVIARSGKFLSEVETGKARITQQDLIKLADSMGVSAETILDHEQPQSGWDAGNAPRRIRDVQPTGLAVQSFGNLMLHLDRSGWLRGARLWMIGHEPFAEERDLALVEQVASLVSAKGIQLRYVFPGDRLNTDQSPHSPDQQGTLELLPDDLVRALRWSAIMRREMARSRECVAGYAVTSPLPTYCHSHTILWVETEDVSWSDVMPLVYCRSMTRTFEKPNESTAFWYHLPRDDGSQFLLELAHQLKVVRGEAPRT